MYYICGECGSILIQKLISGQNYYSHILSDTNNCRHCIITTLYAHSENVIPTYLKKLNKADREFMELLYS